MSDKSHESLPNPKDVVEQIRNINFSDHKKAGAALGLAAVTGIGVGVYTLSKKFGGKKVSIEYSHDRRDVDKRVSIVEQGAEAKFAVGVPLSEDATNVHDFSMDDDGSGIVRPDNGRVGSEEIHKNRLRKAADFMIDIYLSRSEPSDIARAEKE